jgi:hypothetical protein
MMFMGVGAMLAVSIGMGFWLKRIAPKVGLLFWIILSLTIILVVIATMIRVSQPDLGP